MATRENLDKTYLRMARELAKLSRATRKKVGCLIVKDTHIIAEGYNGTPKGFQNKCEDIKVIEPNTYINQPFAITETITKPEVIHAEMNAIAKLCRSTQSSEGAYMYLTLSPCFECSKLIIQSGITKVIYAEEYRDKSGIEFLRQAGVTCFKLDPNLPEDPCVIAS